MADKPEDVLELTGDQEIEPDEGDEDPNVNDSDDEGEPDTDDAEGDEPTETIIGFAGEEAAPASESESSVIRDLRKANRELARRVAEQERGAAPKKIEVGNEPSLADCEYDEDKFKAEFRSWEQRKAQAERQQQEADQRAAQERETWTKRVKAYEANKAQLNVPDFADAEAEVFATLPEPMQALIMRTEKPAGLIYALARNPAKLEELSKLDLVLAAMTLGKLEDKLQVTTRKLPQPDRPVRGNAAPASADKTLARLEQEAARTGDRTKLINYKRELKRA